MGELSPMQRPGNLQKVVYLPRLILYSVTLILCGIFLYIYLVVTPRIKLQSVAEIEALFRGNVFDAAMQKCQDLGNRFSGEPVWFLWLGRCYDGLAQDIASKKSTIPKFLEKARLEFYSVDQKKRLQSTATELENFVKLWEGKDLQRLAQEAYQKAWQISSDWKTGIAIVESHLYMNHPDEATKLFKQLSAPTTPIDKAHHALVQTELCAKSAKTQQDFDVWEKQCLSCLELWQSLPSIPSGSQIIFDFYPVNCYRYLANISEKKGDFVKAEEYYTKAAVSTPEDPGLLFEWGKLQQKACKANKAEEIFENLVRKNPSWDEAHYELAMTRAQLWKKYPALSALAKALSLQKYNHDSPYIKLAKSKDWEKFHKDPDFQMLLGWSYPNPVSLEQELRDAIHFALDKFFDKAIASCQKVLQADPKNYPAYLVWLYSLSGQKSSKIAWDKKIAEATKKLQEPELPLIDKISIERWLQETNKYMERTTLQQFDLGKCDTLITQTIAKIRELADTPFINICIASCYFRFEWYRETIDFLKTALPKVEDAEVKAIGHYMQGYSHLQCKEYQEAEQNWTQAQILAPQNPVYAMFHGQTLAALEKTEAAAEAYHKYAQMTQDVPLHQYYAGQAFLAIKKSSDAQKLFERCTQLSPNFFQAWYQLAKIAIKENKQPEAFQLLEKSFQNNGNVQVLSSYLRNDTEWRQVYAHPEFLRILRTYSK